LANSGIVGEYTTAGTTVNASLISGVSGAVGLALDGDGHLFVSSNFSGIGEYTLSGEAINASIIAQGSQAIACDGNGHLFVAVNGGASGRVDEYSTSGALIQQGLISGLGLPTSLTYDGNGHLFVGTINEAFGTGGGTVGEYTITGATVNANLISSGINYPLSIALDGLGDMFIADIDGNAVREYTTSGTPINSTFISTVWNPGGVAFDSAGNLFVTSDAGLASDGIGEYSPSGQAIDASFITTDLHPSRIVIDSTPEPASLAIVGVFGIGVVCRRRKR
jgi:sugar lactone lactonase YvrE